VPIWSAVFGIILLGEALSAQLFIALALILLGIGISQWRSLVLVAQSIRSKK
jgi:drug/metabolite transporter (DMT)-like permease